jgi:ABC-type glutathione transport system ATPase component
MSEERGGAAQALLEVSDLKTFFHRRGAFGLPRADDYVPAVDGVSLGVGEGETLGIVGESGCGKTTLGRTILRLVPATSGSVRYRGEEILGLSASAFRAKRREMQMIFQDLDAALNPKMRISDLLAEALTLHRTLSREQVRRRSEELLDLVKLCRPKPGLPARAFRRRGGASPSPGAGREPG